VFLISLLYSIFGIGIAFTYACGGPSDKMVLVGSWCVDQYESSICESTSGLSRCYFQDSNVSEMTKTLKYRYPSRDFAPSDFSLDGVSAGKSYFAVSRPGVVPARGMTWFQAYSACLNSGKTLLPDAVWTEAAIGSDPAKCNVWSQHVLNQPLHWSQSSALKKTGEMNQCKSKFAAHDMLGNAWEWVAGAMGVGLLTNQDDHLDGYGEYERLDFKQTGEDTGFIMKSTVAVFHKSKKHGLRAYVASGLLSQVQRGGDYHTGKDSGIFTVSRISNPLYANWHVGFRCGYPVKRR